MFNETKLKTLNLDVDLNAQDSGEKLLIHLRDTGCAVLHNHGINVAKLKNVLEPWHKYFIDDKKHQWLRADETDEGYIPLNFEMQKNGEIPDYKELYQAHYKKPFPDIIDSISTEDLFADTVNLGTKICTLLDDNLPSTIKNGMSMPLENMVKNSNNHLLRVIHYPPIPEGTYVPRSAIHTDICLFTIVFGSVFGGLELEDHNGELYIPHVTDDCLVVFTAEMIEYGTNGYIKAAMHQVEANHNSYFKSRYSFITGIHPRRDVILHGQKTAGEYLRDKLNFMGYNGNSLDLTDH